MHYQIKNYRHLSLLALLLYNGLSVEDLSHQLAYGNLTFRELAPDIQCPYESELDQSESPQHLDMLDLLPT